MSYILDALRKSEQERQRGKLPDLNSFEEPKSDAPARNIWPWITTVVIAVNITVIAVVWAPWRGPAPIAVPAQSAPVQQAHPVPAPFTAPPQAAYTQPVSPPPAPVQSAPAPVLPPRESGPPTVVVDNRPPVQSAPTRVDPAMPEPVPDVQPGDYAAPAPNVAYLPQLDELSPADRAGIPDMTFSSHMYSSMPRFRSIIINGKRLKEGEYFTSTLQVREITEKGVIMSNGATLFSVDVLGRWAQ
ncbi:MAG: general secretion pathway protein GspB [Gammaproteobacteria bacterium]